MSKLVMVMGLLVDTFNQYSARDREDARSLTRTELKSILHHELGSWIHTLDEKPDLDAIFKDLDQDGDNVVSFSEFGKLFLQFAEIMHQRTIAKPCEADKSHKS